MLTYKQQMRWSTVDLRRKILNGEMPKSQFSEKQLEDIKMGKHYISNFVWHFHQELGRIQLVPEELHEKARHVGWEELRKAK